MTKLHFRLNPQNGLLQKMAYKFEWYLYLWYLKVLVKTVAAFTSVELSITHPRG